MSEDITLPNETTTETAPEEIPHKSMDEIFEEAFFDGMERVEKPVHTPHVGDDYFGEVKYQKTSEADQQAFLEVEHEKLMENHLKTVEDSIQAQHGVDLNTYINDTEEYLINEGYSPEQANQMILDSLNEGVQLDEKALLDHEILGLMAAFSKDKGRGFGDSLNDNIPKSVFQVAAEKNIPLSQSYNEHREAQKAREEAFDSAFLDGFENGDKRPWEHRKPKW